MERLLAALAAWDRARTRPRYRLVGTAVCLALGIVAHVAMAGAPAGARAAAALTVAMSTAWLGGVLPMAVTALTPLVAMPLLGLGSVREAAAPYADPLNVLMLGGFLLAAAMEQVGLHRRVVAAMLAPAWIRATPGRVALGLMAATATVSAFVNNTAAMLMMLPTAMALATALGADRRMRAAFTLVTAYASSIGGVTTLVGTAPNAVLAGLAPRLAGREVTFVGWLGVGVPFVLLAIPTAWWMVTRVALPLPRDHRAPPTPPQHPGPWSFGETAVGTVVGACLLAWLTRNPVDLGAVTLPGWGPHVPGKVDDGFVAIAGALVLFLLPGEALRRGSPPPPQDTHGDDADEALFLLSWRRMARAVPWSVLVLMGGGFAMADAIQRSGLSVQLAGGVARLGALPPVLQVLGVCVGIAFLSAFTSNTATTQVALPLLGAGAAAAGIDPLAWMVPATISASCDFALAVGTPPNAIAAEAGDVTPGEMATAGVALNVLCAVLATAVVLGPGAWALAP